MKKLFSRSSSPLSLEPPSRYPSSLSARSSASTAPPASAASGAAVTTTTTASAAAATAAAAASPPRRPRLRHGEPPFFEGWANVRPEDRAAPRRGDLRFCTLAGPTLRYSASPSHRILREDVCVYGAVVSAESSRMRIVVRPAAGGRLVLFPETAADHVAWARELTRAATRCVTEAYAFAANLRHCAFGRVSAAVDVANGLPACVKIIAKATLSAHHVACAQKEAALLLGIPEHAGIAAVRDVYESARTVYLVTDLVPGCSLREMVAGGDAVSEAEVAVIVRDLLHALVHMHAHGVVHRMICPENVLVDLSDDAAWAGGAAAVAMRPAYGSTIRAARLCNFELAVSGAEVEDAGSVLDSFSESGPLHLRHAMYMAPEVAGGRIGEYAQDVWSLGVLMHYMLMGCTPFDNGISTLGNLTAVIASTKGMPSFSGPLWRGISSGAKHLCASMLHADPKARVKASLALRHPWLNL